MPDKKPDTRTQAQKFADTIKKIMNILILESIRKREHSNGVLHFPEAR